MTSSQERKQQERQARRRRIQLAARTVFADRGYAKTSIEMIAREASLSVGAIYLYFRSKEDLYMSLLEETLELFDGELREIEENSGSGDAKLRTAWSFLIRWAETDVEAARVLRLASQPSIRQQLSDEVAERVGAGIATLRRHIASFIAKASETGVYQAGNGEADVDLIWALFLGVLQASDAKSNLDLPGADLQHLSQNAFAAIDANLRTPRPGNAARAA